MEIKVHIINESHRPDTDTIFRYKFYSHVTHESARLSKVLFKNDLTIDEEKLIGRVKGALRFGSF